jgi:hypothetical protein
MFYLFHTYVAFKCFMLQVFRVSEVCSESHGGTTQAPGEGARRAWGPADGVCSSSSRLLGPARVERERERGGGRSGEHRARRDRQGRGMRAWWDDADGEGLQRYRGSATCFCWTVRYRPIIISLRTFGRQQFPCNKPFCS